MPLFTKKPEDLTIPTKGNTPSSASAKPNPQFVAQPRVQQQAQTTVATQPLAPQPLDGSAPFILKTEMARNILVVKLNEAMKDLKMELVRSTPNFQDMDLYLEALKEDIRAINIVKDCYKMK